MESPLVLARVLPAHFLKPTVSSFELQQFESACAWPTEYISFLFSSGPALSASDAALFKRVVQSCVSIVDFLSGDVVSSHGGKTTPAHVLRTFEGVVASSLQADWITADTADAKALRGMLLTAYRVAFKALYDCAALASLEILTSTDDPSQFDEFHTYLAEYENAWMLAAPVAGNKE